MSLLKHKPLGILNQKIARIPFNLVLLFMVMIKFGASVSIITGNKLMMTQAAVLEDICDSSLACSVIDSTWPSDKSFTCGSKVVSPTAIQTATMALTVGKSRIIPNGTTWPDSATQSCGPIKTNYSRHSYSNGVWTIYYTIQKSCNCKKPSNYPDNKAPLDSIPTCNSATSQNLNACNLARFKFCSMEMNNSPCSRQ